jgi:hypothetical protein
VWEVLDEMKTRVRRRALIVNRLPDAPHDLTGAQNLALKESGFDTFYFLPCDDDVKRMDETAGTMTDISATGGMYRGVDSIMKAVFS